MVKQVRKCRKPVCSDRDIEPRRSLRRLHRACFSFCLVQVGASQLLTGSCLKGFEPLDSGQRDLTVEREQWGPWLNFVLSGEVGCGNILTVYGKLTRGDNAGYMSNAFLWPSS